MGYGLVSFAYEPMLRHIALPNHNQSYYSARHGPREWPLAQADAHNRERERMKERTHVAVSERTWLAACSALLD